MDIERIRSKISSVKSKLVSVKSKISKKLSKRGILPPKLDFDKRVVEDIFKEFSPEEATNPRFAVLGIGNDLKGDDGIGWYVVDKLSKEFKDDKDLLFVKTSVPENHVKQINEFAPKMLIIIDAADFKKYPGTVKTIKGYQVSESFVSTHTTPLTLFLRLYESEDAVKKNVMLIGIQRKSNEFGQPINEPVRKAGDKLVKVISKLYRKGILDLSLEKELEYSSNPLKKVVDYFRQK
jgi:hydrogenase 3 maturation protease